MTWGTSSCCKIKLSNPSRELFRKTKRSIGAAGARKIGYISIQYFGLERDDRGALDNFLKRLGGERPDNEIVVNYAARICCAIRGHIE